MLGFYWLLLVDDCFYLSIILKLVQMKSAPFKIYSASAGSGKTFTLVKEYLKICLKTKSPQKFMAILAITFTNKAATEMKERIIKSLKAFSDPVNTMQRTLSFF